MKFCETGSVLAYYNGNTALIEKWEIIIQPLLVSFYQSH